MALTDDVPVPFDRSNVIVVAEVEFATEDAMKVARTPPLDWQTINDEGGQQLHYERFCRVGA